jgi:hydrogenase maturation protease
MKFSTPDLDGKVQPRVLLAGLGNLLLMDDGVGVHAVKLLQSNLPAGILAVEVGTAVLDALHLFEWADKIIAVDAISAGGPPGTLYQIALPDIDTPPMQQSLHELNLLAAFRFLTCKRKPEISVLGIEPETIDFGLELTPAVSAALPLLNKAILNQIQQWQNPQDNQLV